MCFPVSVTFTCEKCGARVRWPDEATDSTKLTCEKCGDDLGTYGDLRNQAHAGITDEVARVLKDRLKRR